MTADLLALLRRLNPWLDTPGCYEQELAARVPDDYLYRSQPGLVECAGKVGREGATWIVGPHQAGRSTWAWKHLRHLPPRVVLVDCGIGRLRDWCADPYTFLGGVTKLVREPAAVFVKDVHHLPDKASFAARLMQEDLPCPLVITATGGSMAGRVGTDPARALRTVRVLPLSLDEVAGAIDEFAPVQRAEMFERHIVVGGYPAAWRSSRPDTELAGLLEAYIMREAADLHRLGRPDAFRALLQLAARHVGSVVNLSAWSSAVGVSVPTASAYLDLMEQSHLVVRLPPFAGGKRAELIRSPVLYFVDCGLRNHLTGDLADLGRRSDRDVLVKNWVFSELWKVLPVDVSLCWWKTRSGAEVDFVIRTPGRCLAIHCGAGTETRPRLGRGARSFLQAYAPDRFLMVSQDLVHTERIEDCTVEWLPAVSVPARALELLTS